MRDFVIDDLTADEKLDLINVLWDSLGPADARLTPSQMEELDRRLALADDEPGIPWDEIEGRLRQRVR